MDSSIQLRNATSRSLDRDTAQAGPRVFAEDWNMETRVKSLPGNALRILNPMLVRRGIATSRIRLLDNRPLGLGQPATHFQQLLVALDLNTQMVHARQVPAFRDGEVDARIVE